MLTQRTAARLDHGLAALSLAQTMAQLGIDADDGERIPEPGRCSLADLAAYCGVSEDTILRLERAGIAKLAAGLIDRGVSSRLAAALVERLDRSPADEADL